MMNLTVTVEHGDLKKEEFRFYINTDYSVNAEFILDRYSLQERDSKRHKWNITRYWDRLNTRNSTIKDRALVPEYEEVKQQVLEQFISKVVFK